MNNINSLCRALEKGAVRVQPELLACTKLRRNWHNLPRRLNEFLLYYAASGKFWFRLQQNKLEIRSGDLLWINPGMEHECALYDKGDNVLLYHFRFRLWKGKKEIGSIGKPQHLHGMSGILPWVAALAEEGRQDGKTYSQGRINACLTMITSSICRSESAKEGCKRMLSSGQCSYIENLVNDFPDARISAHDLAKELKMSVTYFRLLFQNAYGMSVREWLVERRVQNAAVLLAESSLPVSEVAYELGYENPALFSRQFSRVFKLSPSDYRRFFSE